MKAILEKVKDQISLQSIIDTVIDKIDEETVVYPDLEVALVGIVMRFGQPDLMCYDYDKVIEIYKKDGMSEDEAREHFDFNTIGAWYGETTPCFIRTS